MPSAGARAGLEALPVDTLQEGRSLGLRYAL